MIPKERRRPYDSSEPSGISDALSELFARRGYGRVRGNQQLEQTWQAVVEKVAGDHVVPHTKVTGLKNGALQIAVSNSAVMSELASFFKSELLAEFASEHPDLNVRDLKFKFRGKTDA